ncbi:MAG TPA: FGGY-family carbohydrate kinase, partial [Spirochaetia bacterium]|nr:FGGY-family carbohydrate kinase [Spirochaetia bacterium]
CKAVVFSRDGLPLASAYDEYDMVKPQPGWLELDPAIVWARIKDTIRRAVADAGKDPVSALAVSSMGESMVPVSRDRRILGNSLLLIDRRGEEYLPLLSDGIGAERLYRINGNILGIQFSLPKLLWIRDHTPEVYRGAWKFLLWSGFVSFMLGADPVVDYSLANRTLLFDVDAGGWSSEVAGVAGIDLDKLPQPVPAGTRIGSVSGPIADELGLARGTAIVAGTHDQCANAVGCGVTEAGVGMSGMGTYLTIVPVFTGRKPPEAMMRLGLNTEHHAAPGRFVSFIYNQGGLLLKWYRDTFAHADRRAAEREGRDVYPELLGEMPSDPSTVIVLPHFTVTGPPEFVTDSSGVMAGLKVETTRGDILKGILEGVVFYHKGLVDASAETGIALRELRAVGGGSRSDAWLQISADILGRPVVRTRVSEAGCLGVALLAAAGTGAFRSLEEGVGAMVSLGERFEPDPERQRRYEERFEKYRALWPLMKDYLRT